MKEKDEKEAKPSTGDKKGLKPEIVKSIADKKKALENDKIIQK
jgi:hypothetical protein